MVEEHSNLQKQWIMEHLLLLPLDDGVMSRLISSFLTTAHNHKIDTILLIRRASSMVQSVLAMRRCPQVLESDKDLTNMETDILKKVLETLSQVKSHLFHPKFVDFVEKAKTSVDMASAEFRRDACLHSAVKFLTRARDSLRPSYLERMATKAHEEVKAGAAGDESKQRLHENNSKQEEDIGVRSTTHPPGEDCPVEGDLPRKKSYGVPTPEFHRVMEALRSSCAALKAAVKDPLPSALRHAELIGEELARRGVKTTTARTFEREDKAESSGGSSSKRPRPCLPPHKSVVHSPLRKKEANIGRRQTRKWSAREAEVLKNGVEKYGRRWELILAISPATFEGRTTVDLSNKWRNMTK